VGKVIVLIQRGEEENKYKMSQINSKKIMAAIKQQQKRSKPEPNKQSTLHFG